MAKWNSLQPIELPDGGRIERGDTIPAKMATPSFIGSHLGALTAFTDSDRQKFAVWKAQNPHVANRWDAILNSPLRATEAGLIVPASVGGEAPATE